MDSLWILTFFVLAVFLSYPLGLVLWAWLRRQKKDSSKSESKIEDLPRGSSHFIELGEHKIHYKVYGQGRRTLLLLHGIGASTYTWRYLVPLLEDGYQILLIDLPGFGKSSKRPYWEHDIVSQSIVVDRMLDQLQVKNVTLVGSSMGGTISMWMACMFPQKYQDLILISPAIEPALAKLFHLPSLRLISWPLSNFLINRLFIKKLLQIVCANKAVVTSEAIEEYYAPYKGSKEAMFCFLEASEILKDKDIWLGLEKLRANILLIWGQKDLVTPISARQPIVERYRGHIQSETAEEAGHHVMEDRPEWLAEKIRSWLR